MLYAPSDASSYVFPVVQVAIGVMVLYAIAAFIRAMQTNGEVCTFYLHVFAHLADPVITLIWAVMVGSVLSSLAAHVIPLLSPFFLTMPMAILLWPFWVDWHDSALRTWARRLAWIGALRWAIIMLYLVPYWELWRSTNSSINEILRVVVVALALGTLIHAHLLLGRVRRHLNSAQPV